MKALIPKVEHISEYSDPNLTVIPCQWVYVLEKDVKLVKIGVTVNLTSRIRTLESQGGFKSRRIKSFGPYQNGYRIENEAHKKLVSHRAFGEWFNSDFDNAVAIISDIAKDIGDSNLYRKTNSPDPSEVFDSIFPIYKSNENSEQPKKEASFRKVKDDHGMLWLEHDDYGLLSVDFVDALLRLESWRSNPNQNESDKK